MNEDMAEYGYSKYGEHTINESLESSLPDIIVKIEKTGKNAFSYFRQDYEDKIIKKKK